MSGVRVVGMCNLQALAHDWEWCRKTTCCECGKSAPAWDPAGEASIGVLLKLLECIAVMLWSVVGCMAKSMESPLCGLPMDNRSCSHWGSIQPWAPQSLPVWAV
eukprot:2082446-Amphidinium_carterae.1